MFNQGMNPDSRTRADSAKATSSSNDNPADHATAFFSAPAPKNVMQVAQTLAAHGGGAMSMGLAFDLVLNDLVEQAREASGASGAAIALLRDGEMVCRATSGVNTLGLGVRVETGSGLAKACLGTGEIQVCRDTDTDSRVNAEACRRLGVRSMLIAPLTDGNSTFGILQAFSAWPNSFGEREISALRGLTQKIADSKREADAGTALAPAVGEQAEAASSSVSHDFLVGENKTQTEMSEYSPFVEPEKPKGNEIWTSILVFLVIAAAVLLGVVIGWRGAANGWLGSQPPPQSSPASAAGPVANVGRQTASPNPVSSPYAPASSAADGKRASTANSTPSKTGGLVITDNGKVIYHTPASAPGGSSGSNAPNQFGTRLIHRVEPEYPPLAREQNIQGRVVLDVQIGGNGAVETISVISGEPLLAEAALKAVRQWRYEPNFIDGHPVESQTRITIRFILPL